MKYLLILGLIALVFYFLLYWRMRRYFPVVRRIFGITRDLYRMQRGGQDPAAPVGRRAPSRAGEKLVRCAACGTWVPAGRAVILRASATS